MKIDPESGFWRAKAQPMPSPMCSARAPSRRSTLMRTTEHKADQFYLLDQGDETAPKKKQEEADD